MKEATLLKIAMITTITGIFLLFIISEKLPIEEIKDIETTDKIDVKLKGPVSRISDLEKVAFITITQPKDTTVLVFKKEKLNISEGDYIEVIGRIEEYEGEKEVIANRIRVIG